MLFGVADRIYIFAAAGERTNHDAGKIVSEACGRLGGRGGGTRALGQGVATQRENLQETIVSLKKSLQ